MDFALILVLLTFGMGAVWAVDALVMKPRRGAVAGEDGRGKEPALVEFCRSFFPIVLAVLLVRSFLYEPFRIPSSSMMPTLRVGDFIFVSKFSYGLRLPVLNSLILELGSPQRGDVAVFRLPSDPQTNYIKRVIGVPGDTVEMKNGKVSVNGERIAEPYISNRGAQDFPATQVEPDHVFVMGDNRPNSQDSRSVLGQIPMDKIVGKAFVLLWPPSRIEWLSDD